MYCYMIEYRSPTSYLTSTYDFVCDTLAQAEEDGEDVLKREGMEGWYPIRVDISIYDED